MIKLPLDVRAKVDAVLAKHPERAESIAHAVSRWEDIANTDMYNPVFAKPGDHDDKVDCLHEAITELEDLL